MCFSFNWATNRYLEIDYKENTTVRIGNSEINKQRKIAVIPNLKYYSLVYHLKDRVDWPFYQTPVTTPSRNSKKFKKHERKSSYGRLRDDHSRENYSWFWNSGSQIICSTTVSS